MVKVLINKKDSLDTTFYRLKTMLETINVDFNVLSEDSRGYSISINNNSFNTIKAIKESTVSYKNKELVSNDTISFITPELTDPVQILARLVKDAQENDMGYGDNKDAN